MLRLPGRAGIILSALLQLGPERLAQAGFYQAGLRSGLFRRLTPPIPEADLPPALLAVLPVFSGPNPLELAGLLDDAARRCLLEEAEEVEAGRVRLFGADPVPLELAPPAPLLHWTVAERAKQHWDGRDIKWTWEPGRFGWVFPLARAYRLTGDSRWAAVFWRHAEAFWDANPPNVGPHWASAQEVALRLLAMFFAGQVFAPAAASTPERLARLARQAAAHARRIPPTLVYARAQNNNHLVSEAAGLYSAGLFLPGLPEARAWRRAGWRWLQWAFEHQIRPDGAYIQHSANYHRFVLKLSLWTAHLADAAGQRFSLRALERLAAAVRWLNAETDPETGEMANLGANDGANPLPLAAGVFRDARPVIQAGSRRFIGQPQLASGPWDELGAWLGGRGLDGRTPGRPAVFASAQDVPGRIHHPGCASWARLRAVHYTERPSHADQLQVELWWRGLNIVRDPGTYLYNAPPPWENALAGAAWHNAPTLDGREPMRRAGRFLWLDWDQAGEPQREQDPAGDWERLTAQRSGYRRLGALHRRTLERVGQNEWRVLDELQPVRTSSTRLTDLRLYWLLPDWDWQLENQALLLQSPYGQVRVEVCGPPDHPGHLALDRAGERLSGPGEALAQSGWFSPTYAVKEPALALVYTLTTPLPTRLVTSFQLPIES